MDLPQAASAAPVTSVGPASFYSSDQLYQQQQQQQQHQQAQHQQAQLQLQQQQQLHYQQQQQHAQQYYQISHQQQQQQQQAQQQHFQQAGQYGIPAVNGAVPLAGNVQDPTAFSKNQINPSESCFRSYHLADFTISCTLFSLRYFVLLVYKSCRKQWRTLSPARCQYPGSALLLHDTVTLFHICFIYLTHYRLTLPFCMTLLFGDFFMRYSSFAIGQGWSLTGHFLR